GVRGRGGRLGGLVLGLEFVGGLVAGHHSLSFVGEVLQVISVFGLAGYHGTILVLIYLGMEPALRRRWPWRITAWNRALAGRLRDPLVGRGLLVGGAGGAAAVPLARLGRGRVGGPRAPRRAPAARAG